jgi:predicted DNA-binding WGR domain protein
MKTLIKIDPQKHMHRWYAIGIQGTLLEGLAVIYGWGSLHSAYQQWRKVALDSPEEAERLCQQMIGTRVKRGYVPAESQKRVLRPLRQLG